MIDQPLPLTLSMKLSLRWLPGEVRQQAVTLIGYHMAMGQKLEKAFMKGGGVTLENTIRDINRDIDRLCLEPESSDHFGTPWFDELSDIVQQLHLRPSDFKMLVDGWNIFFIRQRYRDDRQRETILLQLVSKPLSFILGLAGVENPNDITGPFGHGLGLAEMVRRFWTDTQQGRIYLSETEITQYNVDLSTITEFRSTPELRTALAAMREKSLIQMQKGFDALKKSKAPRYMVRSMEQFQIWEETNMEKAQNLNFNPVNKPIELSYIKTYRLFWFQ